MNNTILHLIKMKNSLRMKIKRSSSPSEYLKNKFKSLCSTIKKMLRDSCLKYMNTICASCDHNPKRFWSFFKTKSKVSNIPGKVSMKENDNERLHADNNTDIANMFNEYLLPSLRLTLTVILNAKIIHKLLQLITLHYRGKKLWLW
jgi:hypothetical protein